MGLLHMDELINCYVWFVKKVSNKYMQVYHIFFIILINIYLHYNKIIITW